ncbi:hypothetical protein CHUAL_000779 [Chamberlinius hualienensis]
MINLIRSSSECQDYRVMEELATVLRGTNGDLVMTSQSKLALTIKSLSCLNRQLHNVDLDESLNNRIGSINSDSFDQVQFDNLRFLHQFIKKTPSLKVTPGSGTVQGCVDLKHFTGLKILELERIPIHLFKGLRHLRSGLEIISCQRCLTSLQDLFASCGGDHALPFSWSELVAVKLNHNDITSLDDSVKLWPLLKSLDLSHNNICSLQGIEFLNMLEHLNLSYNSLHHFPIQIKACMNLKFLFLKNNCLDSLRGLECLGSLQEIDLSYNCVTDHCNLSPLYSLNNLKKINLEGNPIAFHPNHRVLTIHHMHKNVIKTYTVFNGKNLTLSEIRSVTTSNFGNKRIVACDECFGDFSLQTIRMPAASTRTDDSSSINSISESHSSGDGHTRVILRSAKRRTRAVREAYIADDVEVEVTKASSITANVVEPSEVSINEHLQTKLEIEKCREEHGREWLIVGSKLKMISSLSHPSSSNLMDKMVSIGESTRSDINDNSAKRSQTSDDVIVLNEKPDCSTSPIFDTYNDATIPCLNNLAPLTADSSKSLSDYFSSDEDDNESSQPYFVHMKNPNIEEEIIVILTHSGNDIKEKHHVTGRTIDTLDLRSLQSFETLPVKKVEKEGTIQEFFRICLTFSYRRKDRRERVYSIEDEQSYKELCDLFRSVADSNTLKSVVLGAMECLKCHSHFSKELVTKVARSNKRLDNVASCSPNTLSKNLPNRVDACPNCFSELIIEIDTENTDLSKLNSEELSSSIRSVALTGSFKSKEQIPNSCPASVDTNVYFQPSFASNSLFNLVTDFKPTSDLTSMPLGANGSSFKVKAEIHHSADVSNNAKGSSTNSSITTDSDLKRWESDVTILSNPSQSSIMVLAHQTPDCNLDSIPEDSDTKRFGSGLENLGCLGSPTLAKLSSCSSDTLTDSMCQTVEAQTRCSSMQLGQTPESFLSSHASLNAVQNVPQEANEYQSAKYCMPLLWSNRDSEVLYSFRDFSHIDHRLKLHLDMNLLGNDDEVIVLLRAGIIAYAKGEEFPGLLVLCHSKVYIMKITTEKPFSRNWLLKVDCLPLDSLAYINVHLGGQAFQLEFSNKLVLSCYIFLLRDADHCNSFICFLMEKLKLGMFNIDQSNISIDTDSQEILLAIREQLFPWKSAKDLVNNPVAPISPTDDGAEMNVYFYVMCYWLPFGTNTSFRPISIAITNTDIYIFSENLIWPLPHLISPSPELLNNPQMIPQIREKIEDLISIIKSKSSPFQMILKFHDEDSGEELDLRLAMETERSLEMLLQAMRNPWEQLFGAELQVLWGE